jgi:hypothetical protein
MNGFEQNNAMINPVTQGGNIQVGIGFATGRINFEKILKTYVYNWQECGLTERDKVGLNLFVAYDLRYKNTKRTDYIHSAKELLHLIVKANFIGKATIQSEIDHLIGENIIDRNEARLLFGVGYAARRNAVLYFAIKNHMDYLLFLDDDEYPVAVTNTRALAVWGGQQVLLTHLSNIQQADITNGHHCGYISPIPYIEFNDTLTEADFRMFIEAISNDIVSWDKIRSVMDNGGVTYADTRILTSDTVEEVREINRAKFISGANLCINLTCPERTNPFYNPPGARGEDTFLSTCLSDRTVLRVPCYTFHDGFSTYRHIMNGVLPTRLKYIRPDSEQIIERFYYACVGWIRYKPLLLYITQREHYAEKIREMKAKIDASLPKVCAYFGWDGFNKIASELDKYDKNAEKHYRQFTDTQHAWAKITEFLKQEK